MARRTTDTTDTAAAPVGEAAQIDGMLGEIVALRREVADLQREVASLRERDVVSDVQAVRSTFELDRARVVLSVPRQLAPGEAHDADRPLVPAILVSTSPDGLQATVATFDPRDGLRFRDVASADLV